MAITQCGIEALTERLFSSKKRDELRREKERRKSLKKPKTESISTLGATIADGKSGWSLRNRRRSKIGGHESMGSSHSGRKKSFFFDCFGANLGNERSHAKKAKPDTWPKIPWTRATAFRFSNCFDLWEIPLRESAKRTRSRFRISQFLIVADTLQHFLAAYQPVIMTSKL